MVGLVLIGYDGSPESGRAISVAAAALDAEQAVVVNVWHDSAVLAGPVPVVSDAAVSIAEREAELERVAFGLASEGASRARALGLPAVPEACGATHRAEIGHVLVGLAEKRRADLVVVGRSGGSLVREAVLGSVSGGAVRDGRCPVLVVPR
jgi:nucleotide-binding universal stress UspA family protein